MRRTSYDMHLFNAIWIAGRQCVFALYPIGMLNLNLTKSPGKCVMKRAQTSDSDTVCRRKFCFAFFASSLSTWTMTFWMMKMCHCRLTGNKGHSLLDLANQWQHSTS
eukprot:scaffold3421_cov187-Ochromonas_danica.AAC.7